MTSLRYITAKEIYQAIGVSKSTFYRHYWQHPLFPRPVTFGERCVRNRQTDVERFVSLVIEGAAEDA